MNSSKHTQLANHAWSVAGLLRGDYKQSDYGKVILPFTVLRHLECVLAPTREEVLETVTRFARDADLPENELPGRRFTAVQDGDHLRDCKPVDDPRI